MEDVNVSWSYDEFKIYLLLYAAESNQVITEEEMEFIEAKFDILLIKAIQKEIKGDNDYQRIQKIMAYIDQHNLAKADLDELLKEIKAVYLSDGKYDAVEQSIFLFLQKLFQV